MSTNPPQFKDRYTTADLGLVGFHDCHVSGVRWDADTFSVTFDLDFILEWVEPGQNEKGFRFWLSPAELRFADVEELSIELAWGRYMMECSIQELHQREKRMTPNGNEQWRWELELNAPEGTVTFWATGFELAIQGAPTLSDTQRLRGKQQPPEKE